MKLKEILKKYKIQNTRKCIQKGYGCRYSIHLSIYDYQPLMENWQNIYNDLSRKIIKPIDEYTSVGEFKKDVARILKSSTIQKYNVYGSFKYKRLNTDLYNKYCENIKDKMYTKENLKNFKKPVITFIEINDWEKERWELIIPLTEENIISIKKFSNLLDKISKYNKKTFSISDTIKEQDDINYNTHGNYMITPLLVEENIDFEKLLKFDTIYKLIDNLNKGQIRNFIKD